ncbi:MULTISPECIES: hypothetical protein [Microbacterium]|uniref:hypothetical protein n=1 Tax=Microbacterium TaxID=33882 RepID=UPI00217F0C14|nr:MULTISPECIES: hypothetical protein [Microbacterium]UWF78547.1 hypothetical protein JSY13_06095 [Microbacterium neungamense]WCM56726.1 hypothetical protein JRG78_06125 [Microbacterium sp. EF45047]
MDDAAAALVPGAHRVIRQVDDAESAFAGVLVADGGRVRVRMPAERTPAPLWRFAGSEHIAGVTDVVRRGDGLDVLLPWCAERVDVFLGRRAAAEEPLATGEAVTLVGSLLRGIGEAGDEPFTGAWWLDGDARPLFVPGAGEALIPAVRALVARVRARCTDRALERLLAEVERMPDGARAVRRRLDGWEDALTELAAPKPLRREVVAAGEVGAGDVGEVAIAVRGDRATARDTRTTVARGVLPAAASAAHAAAVPWASATADPEAGTDAVRRRAGAGRTVPSAVIGRAAPPAGTRVPLLRAPLGAILRWRTAPSERARRVTAEPGTHPPGVRAAVGSRLTELRMRGRGGRARMRTSVMAPGEQAARTPGRVGRRPLLVGAAAAVAVLAAGILWPAVPGETRADERLPASATAQAPGSRGNGDADPAAAGAGGVLTRDTRPEATDSGAGDGASGACAAPGDCAAGDEAGASAAPADLVRTGQTLLAGIARCRAEGDAECAEAIAPGAAPAVQENLAAGPASAVELVEDYGDVAVLRVSGDGTGPQIVVLARADGRWLVRDVYDIADQPSGPG